MSKIICDVCGTSYAESATQCPICGCVRPSNAIPVDIDADNQDAGERKNYTYVKGGRFSKANVKKRQMGLHSESLNPDDDAQNKSHRKRNGDIGLIVAVCVLLLAILAVVIYIAFSFLLPLVGGNANDGAYETTTENVTETTTNNTEDTQLESITETTEVIETTETVAETTEETIVETTGETMPTVPSEEYKAPFVLNTENRKNDVTIKIGETFVLKLIDANGKTVPVVWEIQKSEICSADGNIIKGLACGRSDVSTTYEGTTYTCIVRVDD